MSDEVYRRLAQFLDNLPGGYPATESGVEIKILKRLFTPEEAALFVKLPPMPEPASAIAARWGMSEAEALPKLESMAAQGSIYRVRTRGGRLLFMAMQFAVGIYEFHLNSIDKELAELMEEYLPALRTTWNQTKTKQLRIAPALSVVDTTQAVDGYDRIRELVKKESELSIAPCICRKEQSLLGHECAKPRETCLQFGISAQYYVDNKMSRPISQDEALKILDQAEKAGLVLMPTNAQSIMNVCMCCGCCCGILRGIKEAPRPADQVIANFRAEIDADACTACGLCLDRCQVAAIEEGDAMRVMEHRCIGCGLCVSTCPSEAIKMVKKPNLEPPPMTMPEMSFRILRERGIIK